MRLILLVTALAAFTLISYRLTEADGALKVQGEAPSSTQRPAGKEPDFDSEIKPIFQARCQPCHFQGGQMYEKLPFDKAATITKLGTKVFTRITDEKERQKITEFLRDSSR